MQTRRAFAFHDCTCVPAATREKGEFLQRLSSTWFKFKFLNCGAEILVCVSWLSETPGQGSAAMQNSGRGLFASRKIKTKPNKIRKRN